MATVAVAAGLFAGTNIDDLVVLAVLFLAGRATGAPRLWQVWAGQATGFTVLVGVSALAALGLRVVPGAWIGLLGVGPLAVGIWGLVKAVRARRAGEQGWSAPATGLVSVAALTVVNGADNLAVYPAVLRTIGTRDTVITLLVFAAGVVVWCLIGSWLGSHEKAVWVIERWGRWIVPGVFVVLGLVILLASDAFARVF